MEYIGFDQTILNFRMNSVVSTKNKGSKGSQMKDERVVQQMQLGSQEMESLFPENN